MRFALIVSNAAVARPALRLNAQNFHMGNRIYDTATVLSRILYQPDKQHLFITIQLSNIALFTFIRFFDRFHECRDYMHQNIHKRFTIFISSINVVGLRQHETNVRRFLLPIEHKVCRVFMYEKFEYELLLFGVDHCKRVFDENEQENPAIVDMALKDGKRLSEALANILLTEYNDPVIGHLMNVPRWIM
ncbi:unnamed protein product [Rotaria magnacalcarata]|uniref:Uncharacterized protein n=1 Tax=Rotaria magnacalcarata TaxID=392030 RepID=A0A820F719_9BILA|nr:unnamed protein product [Rotaria magnacalcarata]CAF4258314.1 unnamed protein product [Rotaria magnacalcarata]CAF4262709.1 unnamed protein product [Rotaria magnacalcarata]